AGTPCARSYRRCPPRSRLCPPPSQGRPSRGPGRCPERRAAGPPGQRRRRRIPRARAASRTCSSLRARTGRPRAPPRSTPPSAPPSEPRGSRSRTDRCRRECGAPAPGPRFSAAAAWVYSTTVVLKLGPRAADHSKMSPAAAGYDPKIIERFAEQLLRKADNVRVGCAVGGGIFGVLVGAVPLTPLDSVWGLPAGFGVATIIVGALIGLLIGWGVCEGRAVRHRGAGEERNLLARDRARGFVRSRRGRRPGDCLSGRAGGRGTRAGADDSVAAVEPRDRIVRSYRGRRQWDCHSGCTG